jgi:hypothetical protein
MMGKSSACVYIFFLCLILLLFGITEKIPQASYIIAHVLLAVISRQYFAAVLLRQ